MASVEGKVRLLNLLRGNMQHLLLKREEATGVDKRGGKQKRKGKGVSKK